MNLATLLPALMRLREFLEAGVEYASALHMSGGEVSVEMVSVFLQTRMSDWNPKVSGVDVLDDETRYAAARFLSGIAVNLVAAADAATTRRSA